MKYLTSIKYTLLAIVILNLTGCAGIPIMSHPTDKNFITKDDSKTLVGKRKEVILEKYGKPYWKFSYENNGYFLYFSPGEIDLAWEIFFPVPGSLYDADYFYCALLRFNQSDLIEEAEYISDVYVNNYQYFIDYRNIVPFCINRLFPKNEAELLIEKYRNE